jgi:hypothetical protein
MLSPTRYELIRTKHGEYASWAVWAESTGKPKSNMGELSQFDKPDIIDQLKSNVIMIALNFSRNINPTPFINFHDANPRANDYKIRYAFKGTPYWGAYMTDVIKSHVEVDSSQVMKYLKSHPGVVTKNFEILREEFADLGADRPLILAFGNDTYQLLKDNLTPEEYSQLIRLTHYSHQISKEKFREMAFERLGGAGCA